MSTTNKKDVHSFTLDALYIEALVEILVFAAQTASFLAHKEQDAGRAGKELVKLTRLVNDSRDIIQLFKASIDIGEPESNSLN